MDAITEVGHSCLLLIFIDSCFFVVMEKGNKMPHEWEMKKETIEKEDGRYLVYFRFPEKKKDCCGGCKCSDQDSQASSSQASAAGTGEGA
jgi:hypothetical protein